MSKRFLWMPAALAALLILSSVAFAGPGHGRGYGPGAGSFYGNLTPEKQAAVDKIFEKHQKAFFDLHEQMWAKGTELEALTRSGKADKADIEALVADMGKIRTQMDQERQSLASEISKETGVKLPAYGYGYGMGGSGYGHHMWGGGYGPMGGGCGYGPVAGGGYGCPGAY